MKLIPPPERYVGDPVAVAFFAVALSTHVETVAPFAGTTPVPAGSVPSNHKAHPEIAVGEKYVEEDILKGTDLEMGTLRV